MFSIFPRALALKSLSFVRTFSSLKEKEPYSRPLSLSLRGSVKTILDGKQWGMCDRPYATLVLGTFLIVNQVHLHHEETEEKKYFNILYRSQIQ